jgi:hypothetical protein
MAEGAQRAPCARHESLGQSASDGLEIGQKWGLTRRAFHGILLSCVEARRKQRFDTGEAPEFVA